MENKAIIPRQLNCTAGSSDSSGHKSDSPTTSMITISSTNSYQEIKIRSRSGSTTASNSDFDEGLEFNLESPDSANFRPPPRFSTSSDNVIVVNTDNNPALADNSRVEINNSTDVQIATNIYNGPVTILLDDKHRLIDLPIAETAQYESGAQNKGFDGSPKVVNKNARHTVSDTCDNKMLKIKKLTFHPRSAYLTFVTLLFSIFVVLKLLVYFEYSVQMEKKVETPPEKYLRIVSRSEWSALLPKNQLTDLVLPIGRVIICHTATDSCELQCILRVQSFQKNHMESKNLDDIGYNFVIGGDGNVYEGRGWDKQGAHTKGFNTGSIGIAYIGTFSKKLPNEAQLNAGFLLLQEGVRLNKLTPDYKIYTPRQLIASESPGAAFFELIKTWPRWTQDVPEVFKK